MPWSVRFGHESMAERSSGKRFTRPNVGSVTMAEQAQRSHYGFGTIAAALGLVLVSVGCSSRETTTLICSDSTVNSVTHVLKVTAASRTAELVVHVPQESIDRGTPAGNRLGTALVSDRAYEITIPGDSGGQGERAWSRLKFQFEIDRYSGNGTLWIGEERDGERVIRSIRCKAGEGTPDL